MSDLNHVDAIPAELKAIPNWCVFALVPQPNGKDKKTPLVAGGKDQKAAIDDPRTFRPFEVALRDTQVRGTKLGFAFTPGLGYFFIDADDVLAPGSEDARPDVRQLWVTLDTYTEVSISGNGIHIIGKGRFAPRCRAVPDIPGALPVERYPREGGRFCLLTGQVLEGYEQINEREAVLHRLFPSRGEAMPPPHSPTSGQLTESEGNAIVGWASGFWTLGRKQHMALYLSGVLVTSGVPLEQAVRIIERCAIHDDAPAEKVKACYATYEKHAAGDPVEGWQGLHDELGLTREETAPLDNLLAVFKQRVLAGKVGRNGHIPDYLSSVMSGGALDKMIYQPMRYVAQDLIPEGCTLLTGAPKVGKSFLLNQLGLAVACGGRFLGKETRQGDVLLLCLEDSFRRLQTRLRTMMVGEPLPANLYLATDWPRIDDGGLDLLREWAAAHPNAALIGIDILIAIRPLIQGKNIYQMDYDLMTQIKRLADETVPLVVLHHNNKAKVDDPFDNISGTNGIAGGADTALVMKRTGMGEAGLHLRGRDVEGGDFGLRFDGAQMLWDLAADKDAPPETVTSERQEVIDLLKRRGPMYPRHIAEALGHERSVVYMRLTRMYQANQILQRGGKYYVPGAESEPPSADGQVIFPWG